MLGFLDGAYRSCRPFNVENSFFRPTERYSSHNIEGRHLEAHNFKLIMKRVVRYLHWFVASLVGEQVVIASAHGDSDCVFGCCVAAASRFGSAMCVRHAAREVQRRAAAQQFCRSFHVVLAQGSESTSIRKRAGQAYCHHGEVWSERPNDARTSSVAATCALQCASRRETRLRVYDCAGQTN